MRIVITGVAGFIGSNLADRLVRDGHNVVGVDNLAYGIREQIPTGVDFRQVDIRDPRLESTLAGAEVVFHLAAKNCIADCQTDPVETSDINVTGSVNVFEAARRSGVRKIIYAESSALYEGSSKLPTPENDIAPQSFYAVSKYASMAFAEAYQRYSAIPMTALRYFCVYGPRQDYRRTIPPLMSAFMIKMLSGERPTIYGSGEKRRDFVYVDDVNDFHVRCIADERTNGNVYNIGSGTNDSVRDIYAKIADLVRFSDPPIFADDQPGEAHTTLADISAARALGWSPQTTLDQGLVHALDFITSHVMPARTGSR